VDVQLLLTGVGQETFARAQSNARHSEAKRAGKAILQYLLLFVKRDQRVTHDMHQATWIGVQLTNTLT
jgi:hypothetical protein